MANSTDLQTVVPIQINYSSPITPQTLLDKWGLEYCELACCLKKTEHTVRKYLFQGENRNSWRNIPETVLELCAQLETRWSQQGYASISIIKYPKK
jgi:hypothetical protein